MNLTTFDFNDEPVRTMLRDEHPWFVAADVCRVLEIANPRDAIVTLDEDEKITVANADGNPRAGIPHSFNLISESGLYALVFKSRKPEAKTFRKWVTAEVLPALRKTGKYELPQTAGIEDRVSLLQFVREACEGWTLDRQIEFGLTARRFCKAMGVVFSVETLPNVGRVFTFPREVLQQVRMMHQRVTALPDPDSAEFERLLEAAYRHERGHVMEPEILRGIAKTMGLFPRVFGENTSLESERSGFGRLAERFDGRVFPNGYCLTRCGQGVRRRYQIRQMRDEAALAA